MNIDYNENNSVQSTSEQGTESLQNTDRGENIHTEVQTQTPSTEKKHVVLKYVGILLFLVLLLVGSWFGWKFTTATPDTVDTSPEESGLVENPPEEVAVVERVPFLDFEEVSTENSHFLQTTEGLEELDTTDLLRQGNFFISTSTERVYYFEKFYTDSKTELLLKEIEGANALEFAVFEDVLSDSRYASDLNTVYFLYQESSENTFNELRIIEGADPGTFKAGIVREFDVPQGDINQGWLSKDKNHVYFQDTIFNEADPESFRVSNNVLLNFDKNNVYLKRKSIPNADPDTYEVLIDTNTETLGVVVGKDKQSFFVDYCQMHGVDTDTVTLETLRVRTDNLIFLDSKGNFKFVYNRGTNKCSIVRF